VGLDADDTRPGGVIAAELDFGRRWGLGFQFDQLASITRSDPYYPGGSLVIARHALTFYGAIRFKPTAAIGLAILAGFRVQHVITDTAGYPTSTHHEILPLGPWIGVLGELRIVGPLLVFGQLQLDTNFNPESFVVQEPSGTFTTLYVLPSTNLGLILGIALRTD
jgi:hypothetical protein